MTLKQTFLVSQYDVKTNMKHYESNPVYEDTMDGIRNKKGELETQVKFYPKNSEVEIPFGKSSFIY
jgi:hypothetical protein